MKIDYRIQSRRQSLFFIIFIVLAWNVINSYFGSHIIYFSILLLIAIIMGSFRFNLFINKTNLVYEIKLFQRIIFNKKIQPEEIQQLKFFRVGWNKKAAIIKKEKGLNIRLAVLEPVEAYDHLINFGIENKIEISKTNDFLLLERMEHNRSKKVENQTS